MFQLFQSAKNRGAPGHSVFGLLLIVMILAGIDHDWLTPTEAAAFAVVYGFLIATVIYRGIGLLKSTIGDWTPDRS